MSECCAGANRVGVTTSKGQAGTMTSRQASLADLFRFMGRHSGVDDIDELLDMFQAEVGFGDERRRELKKAYHAKCGKLLRDPKYVRAIESGQRQARRVKQRQQQKAGNKKQKSTLTKPQRAKQIARSAIQPALLASPTAATFEQTISAALQPVNVAEEIDNAVEEEEVEDEEQQAGGLGGVSSGEEEHEGEAEEGDAEEQEHEEEQEQAEEAEGAELDALTGVVMPLSLSPIVPVTGRRVRSDIGGGGRPGKWSSSPKRQAGSSSRSAEDLRDYERALAKIRVAAHIEPWRDEQAVVNAAEQMKEFGVLIPTDSSRYGLTWPDIDLVIRIGKRRRMAMVTAAGGESGTRSGGSAVLPSSLVASSSSPPPLDAVADRAEWMASRMSQMIPAQVLAEFGDEDREVVSGVVRAVDRNRAKAAMDFAAALRQDEVPEHSAMRMLEDVGEIGDVGMLQAVNKEAVHIIEAQEKVSLRTHQACYNALAISKAIDSIMRTHITGMILSGLCEREEPNMPLITRIAAIHKQASTQLLGAVDYLNQGAR